ncbi:PoNe immunity protein domain-containing protein [Neisseria sp. P0008.S010]|uniref:PoNe immunity protein domain-containing protein n=1 Tax=Neisseria sp. P0008.S010 TaxID=3436707 RepID=UPI003F7CF463
MPVGQRKTVYTDSVTNNIPVLMRKAISRNCTLLPPKNPDNPFEPSGIPRGRLLRDYLKGWYKTNKDTYWYDYHKVRDGELFFGYWAFETAIFTLLLHADMEGQPLKAMSFYPKDYIEYARKHGFAVLDGI